MDYRVQPGDTMSAIARKFHITLVALEAANPQIVDPNRIFPNELVHNTWSRPLHLTTRRRFRIKL
jgi:hypothetical protein